MSVRWLVSSCPRADGQEKESFLKAIFRKTIAGRISALFPTDFIIMLENYCRRIHSDQTHRIELIN